MTKHHKKTTLPINEIQHTALLSAFGAEYRELSATDQALIRRDCTDDGGVEDFAQYRRNIGYGNLASYARVMRVRFAKSR